MYASWSAIITVQALHCTCCAHKVYVYLVQTGEQKVGLCVHVCVCGLRSTSPTLFTAGPGVQTTSQLIGIILETFECSLVPRPLPQKAERGFGDLSDISCHMGRGRMV